MVENTKTVSITLDDDSISKLDKISKKIDRNRSDTIRQLIKEWQI